MVALTMLNNNLKVYRFLSYGKGSFSRWRPRWLLGSYNEYMSTIIQRRKLVLVSKRRFWAQGSRRSRIFLRRGPLSCEAPKSTRFSGGGGRSRIFPWSPEADAIQWGGVVAEFFRGLQKYREFAVNGALLHF